MAEHPIVSTDPETQKMFERRIELIPETCCHDEILPCPFCNKRPETSYYPTLSVIECNECGIAMSGHGPLSKHQLLFGVCHLNIVRRWNTRYHHGQDATTDRKQLEQETQKVVDESSQMRNLLADLAEELDVIVDSNGIAGYHMNGAILEWDETEFPELHDKIKNVLKRSDK